MQDGDHYLVDDAATDVSIAAETDSTTSSITVERVVGAILSFALASVAAFAKEVLCTAGRTRRCGRHGWHGRCRRSFGWYVWYVWRRRGITEFNIQSQDCFCGVDPIGCKSPERVDSYGKFVDIRSTDFNWKSTPVSKQHVWTLAFGHSVEISIRTTQFKLHQFTRKARGSHGFNTEVEILFAYVDAVVKNLLKHRVLLCIPQLMKRMKVRDSDIA